MIEYVSGKVVELTPTFIVIENNGIGHVLEISLQTYEQMRSKTDGLVYVQNQFNQRDGSSVDYGFATKDERSLFRLITSVSGMGASSARMVLSSMSSEELRNTILSEDISRLKSVKGIGLKTAQRMVLELKDKIVKGEEISSESLFKQNNGTATEEAASALQQLGFSKPNINKAIQSILKKSPDASVEQIIKGALQIL